MRQLTLSTYLAMPVAAVLWYANRANSIITPARWAPAAWTTAKTAEIEVTGHSQS